MDKELGYDGDVESRYHKQEDREYSQWSSSVSSDFQEASKTKILGNSIQESTISSNQRINDPKDYAKFDHFGNTKDNMGLEKAMHNFDLGQWK